MGVRLPRDNQSLGVIKNEIACATPRPWSRTATWCDMVRHGRAGSTIQRSARPRRSAPIREPHRARYQRFQGVEYISTDFCASNPADEICAYLVSHSPESTISARRSFLSRIQSIRDSDHVYATSSDVVIFQRAWASSRVSRRVGMDAPQNFIRRDS